jgi:iron complex outermembrane receptor protein
VYIDYDGFTDWATLPIQLSEIRQIEVVKGPNSALFGFNAAGGVINIVTFNPLYDKVNEVMARYGTQSYKEGAGVVTGQIPNIAGVRLSAGGYDTHPFGTTSASTPKPTIGPEKRSVNMDSVVQVTDAVQAGLEASYNTAEHPRYIESFTPGDGRSHENSLKGAVSASTGIGQIDTTVYRNFNSWYSANTLTFNNAVTVAKVQDLFKAGADHTFRLTGEYRYDEMDTAPTNIGRIFYSDFSGSGMWDWTVTPRLDLTSAARWDTLLLRRSGLAGGAYPSTAFDRSINKASGNEGAVYKLTDLDSLRATFGRGVQLPDLQEYAFTGGPGIPLTGNPYLQPLVTTNYELGYSRAIPDINSKISSSIFYQTNDNFSTLGPSGSVTTYVNTGNATARGGELGFDGRNDGFRWGGTWRTEYIHQSLTVDNSTNAYPADYSGSAPHQLFTARLGYTLDRWDFDLFGRYSTSYSMPQTTGGFGIAPTRFYVPDYATLDARIGYHLTDNVELALSGLGLEAKSTIYTSGQPISRQVYGTVKVKF